MIDTPMLLEATAPHPGFYVFADRDSGLIRGWASQRLNDIARHELGNNEVTVKVDRQPNLLVDKYVNLATGAMSAEAVEQGA